MVSTFRESTLDPDQPERNRADLGALKRLLGLADLDPRLTPGALILLSELSNMLDKDSTIEAH